jgi:hypothetical protein
VELFWRPTSANSAIPECDELHTERVDFAAVGYFDDADQAAVRYADDPALAAREWSSRLATSFR